MARTYSAREIAAESGAPEDRITWLVSLGLLKPDERGSFSFGAVFAAKMVSALLDAGLPETTVERAGDEGWLDFRHLDYYLPHEPGRRSDRNFAEFQATAYPRASFLPAVYELLGLPKPNPSAAIHVDEEKMFQRFLEGWRLAQDDDSLLRAARLIAEGTRAATLGWAEPLDEQIAAPAHPEAVQRDPEEVSGGVLDLVDRSPPLPQLHEGLLGQILRVLSAPHDEVERFVQTLVLLIDERVEVRPGVDALGRERHDPSSLLARDVDA